MSDESPDHRSRCGSCARFVRVIERVDDNGEVKRTGECLLGVWPSPLYETSTCSQWVQRGTFTAKKAAATRTALRSGTRTRHGDGHATEPEREIRIPEELLDMDADEFRDVLRQVLREELGVKPVPMSGRWVGGEMIMKPGKEGTAEKSVPIETFFHKIVMLRDRLRVLEQRINSNAKLEDDEKVQLQQYITQCYGSLTTFNVLFAERADGFTGQKGDRED